MAISQILILCESESAGGMISLRCNLSLLDTIRQKLGNENMSSMKASCFGHLFSIPDLKFQGQLHNMLLMRLVNSSLKHLLLSFNINGRNLDFTPADFAIITGLKFRPCCILPVESELHRSVFRSKYSITVDEIEKAFKAKCHTSAGCSELSLKLAFLLILFGILLVHGSSNKNVDMTYFHLVDDIQNFQLFPWGEVAYDLVVRHTHRAKASKPVKFDIVHTYFRNVKPETLVSICPTDFEKPLFLVLGVHEIPSLLLKNNQQAQSVKCGGSQLPATDAGEKPVSVLSVEESLPVLNITVNDPVVANLQRRVAELEQYIYEINPSRQLEVNSIRIKKLGLRSGSNSAHVESNKPTVTSHTPKRSKKVSQVSTGKRRSNLQMPQLRRPHLLCAPNPYDPNESEYMLDHVNAFENWVDKASKSTICSLLHLPISMAPIVDAVWFQLIWSREGWLRNDHIDTLLNLLIIMAKKEPARFLHGWTIMEMICWSALTQDNYCIVSERVGPYVRRAYPR
ncbi:hypothetical protein C2S51_015945 [Perilla frutescens var. frutescens]|nr:hypothetical protein C2S51_015945 [Perilla frutescens var. frutescens]